MATEIAVRPSRHLLDRMFQMRFGFFMYAVAGCAFVCWSINYYYANIDIGRSMFNQQINTLRTSGNAYERRSAAQALDGVRPSQLGEGAPALIAATRDVDPGVRAAAASSLATSLVYYFNLTNGEIPPQRDAGSLALIALLADKTPAVRVTAARSLDIISQQNRVQGGKRKSLGLDPKIVSAPLKKLLDDSDPIIAMEAFRTLRNIGTDPATMLPALRRIAHSKNSKVRAEAIAAIALALRSSGDSPDELIGFLDESEPVAVRIAAASCLNKPWRDGDKVASALARRLDSSDPAERAILVWSLASNPSLPAEVVPALIRVMGRDHGDIRDESQRQMILDQAPIALMNTPPAAAVEAVSALSRIALKQKSLNNNAARALAKLASRSPEAKVIVPRLIKEFRDTNNDQDRVALAVTLGSFGADAAEAAPLLLEAISMQAATWDLRTASCKALEGIGPEGAKFTVPALAKIAASLSDKQLFPDDVYDAIFSLDPNSPEAAELLVKLVEISEASHRGDTRKAIGYLEKLPKRLVLDNPTLKTLAASPDTEVKARARSALKLFTSQ